MVLPAINGTDTTISHGGLLEVAKTFQTVDQSQEEYERNKMAKRKSVVIGQNPAVLTAAGIAAGMIPATLALAVPMMLGRRKRSLARDFSVLNLPYERNRESQTS